MKKPLSIIVVAAALFATSSPIWGRGIVLYTEDWGTTNGGTSFPAVGWTLVAPPPGPAPYEGFYSATAAADSSTGNPLPTETIYYTGLPAGQTGMFYTV
ncbi:MAG TPA: hypothetical protein VGR14_12530, partial [Verrucomicrobiae bacterium]|nr:hypothetical protein [Verrucomicrobiae bacterium]